MKMSIGVVTAMAGFFMYSHCKLAATKRMTEEQKVHSPPLQGANAGIGRFTP